ncbi:integrin alpha [Nocardiopsis sp. LOL_012]|uniref:integrin alpha n=1 Tax=Nocardiopsis sp. LOL_012 TaxID=3345409 RepID=UPI003A8A2AC3
MTPPIPRPLRTGALTAAMVMALVGLGASSAQADTCQAGAESDFNGDGTADLAIGDPDADVGGVERAGRITVAYGGGGGAHLLERGSGSVPGSPGQGDRFGEAMDTFDHDGDGCTDLIVGLPYEDVNGLEEAGAALIVYGSPTGLGEGAAAQVWDQDTAGFGGSPEADDWFGHAVAAGNMPDGEPYAVIGIPGESIGDVKDAGYIQYVRGDYTANFHQDTDGVPGATETNDRYGFDVVVTDTLMVIGSPGEASGPQTFAGHVHLFNHEQADTMPDFVGSLNQDLDSSVSGGVTDVAEVGDRTGTSVHAIDYLTADGSTETMIAIGSPGEDLGTGETDTGAVHVFSSQANGTRSELFFADRDTGGMDLAQSSDFLGQHVRLVDTTPGQNATTTSIKLIVGTPGHTVGQDRAAGMVQVFHPLTGAVTDRVDLDRSGHAALGAPVAGGHFGMSFRATADDLYLATPFDPDDPGAVHAVSWTDLESGTPTWNSWIPGQNGIPAGGTAFGAALG